MIVILNNLTFHTLKQFSTMANKKQTFKHIKYGDVEGVVISKTANQFSIKLSKQVKTDKDQTLKVGEFLELKKSELVDFDEDKFNEQN